MTGNVIPLFGAADGLDPVVDELRRYEGWPVDDARDRQFVKELMERYPTVNLKNEAFKWRTWMSDHTQKKEVKPRARFARWVDSAASKRVAAASARKDRSGKSSRTAPGGREAFGLQSSQTLSGW